MGIQTPVTTHHEASGHHWEVSWAPMAISVVATFLLPLAFACYFVYHATLLAAICAGLGAPLVLAGVSRWIHEGATQKMAISGIADVGIGVFIISEILIFVSLFASYWTMRISMGAEGIPWPPAGTPEINKTLPLIMTVILVASSVTYHIGELRFYAGDNAGLKQWTLISIALGLIFVGCTGYEYTHLANAGFVPSTNVYASAFFGLTGFHASHVILGAVAFVWVYIAVSRGAINKMFVKCAGIYWHFVDVIWFFVASQVYYW